MILSARVPYLAAFFVFSTFWSLDMLWSLVVQLGLFTAILTMFTCGLAIIYVSKPREVKSVLWLPFVYCYCGLQAFIALYAMILIVLRRPRVWTKTDKKGVVAGPAPVHD